MKASHTGWILGAILFVGFVFRLVGLGFGLPELYHADEPIIVNHAMAYGTGDFNPHFFQIPPLISYVLFFAYGMYFCVGRLAGWFADAGVFADLFFSDPTRFYLIGRFLLGAVAGTATIAAVFFLGRRVAGQRAGLWAAGLLSVTFLHVRDSHTIYTDIPLCLALVLAIGAILYIVERGGIKDYVWAGVWVGLCTAIKYNAALVGGAYLAAHLLRGFFLKGKLWSGRFWAGVAAALAAFALANPFAVLDYSFFLTSFARQGQAQGFVGWLHHLTYSLAGGMGVASVVGALAGIVLAVARKNIRALVLLGFLVPFYVGITFLGQPHDRYCLPLIPFLLVFLAIFIEALLERSTARLRWGVLAGIIAVFVLPTAVKSVWSDELFLQPDSRTQAKRWIEEHVPAGTKIALDHTFTVPRLLPSQRQLEEKIARAAGKAESAGQKKEKIQRMLRLVRPDEKRYDLYFLSDEPEGDLGFLFGEPRIPFDFERLKREGIRVVVGHRLRREPSHAEFFDRVRGHCVRQYSFSPYRDLGREYSLEPQVRTGGAFLWREMFWRHSNGEFVVVYLLE